MGAQGSHRVPSLPVGASEPPARASCASRSLTLLSVRAAPDRARRIKCDETQPRCKKCIRRGLCCHYTLRWRPLAEDAPPEPKQAPVVQAEPPSWHFMEAIRYCMPAQKVSAIYFQ